MSERIEHDAYYTNPQLAAFLVELLFLHEGIPRARYALEPSCGQGAFARVLAEFSDSIMMVDVQDQREYIRDILESPYATFVQERFEALQFDQSPDLIGGNPPFNQAEEHVRKAIEIVEVNGTVAFLLRLAFLESQDRIPFWKEFPAESIYVLSERPSFTGGRTDKAAYAFFVWRKRMVPQTAPTKLRVVSWRQP